MIKCSGGLHENPITEDKCIDCAKKNLQTDCGFSYPLVNAILSSDEGRNPNEIHVTDLTSCLRRAYYKKKDPQPDYLHNKLSMFIGTAVHAYIEKYNPDYCEKEVDKGGLKGRIDYLDENENIIDFKTTRYAQVSKLPYGEHHNQTNIYRSLQGATGNLYIQYIDLSGASRCPKCKGSFTPVNGALQCKRCGIMSSTAHLGAVTIEVPIIHEYDNYINDRVSTLRFALDNNTRPEAEPGWICDYCSAIQCEFNGEKQK